MFAQIWQTLDGKREILTEMKKIKVRQSYKPTDLDCGGSPGPRLPLRTCSTIQQWQIRNEQGLQM
jgi:hypothetical protein